MTDCDARDGSLRKDVENLPPSAKLVFIVLEHEEACTQNELSVKTFLPQRTVRYALQRLEEEGVITEQPYFVDARQSLYSLTEQSEE